MIMAVYKEFKIVAWSIIGGLTDDLDGNDHAGMNSHALNDISPVQSHQCQEYAKCK